MVQKEFIINNKLGLHARPAALFVKVSNRFESEIWVEKDDEQVNGKSIMGVLTLAAEFGSELTVRAEGTDAEDAVTALAALIGRGFEEA